MAWVYRATSSDRPEPIAVKILHPSLAADASFQGRFRLEAKTAMRIDHPNAVRVYEYGEDGGWWFIAMELIEGPNLFHVVEAEGRIETRRALGLAAQICEVLQAAHQHGILHRDLKPENVVVMGKPPAERVKVLDFGLAKIYAPRPGAENTSSSLTIQGTVVGTPEFMSPEQCAGDKLDQRSDVYACGALLYNLLSGQLAFQGKSPYETMMLHMSEPVTPPSEIVSSIPRAVEQIVLKAMAKKPSARYQTARHLHATLTKLLADLAGGESGDAIARAQSAPWVDAPPPTSAEPLPADFDAIFEQGALSIPPAAPAAQLETESPQPALVADPSPPSRPAPAPRVEPIAGDQDAGRVRTRMVAIAIAAVLIAVVIGAVLAVVRR